MDPADAAEPHLEPAGRRHVREARRAPHHRRQRRPRRRARLRQDQRQDARPRVRGLRWRRLGPDPVVGVHRQRGLAGHRQEPVGHAVQPRPARPPGHAELVLRPGAARATCPATRRSAARTRSAPDKQIQSGTAAMGLSGSWMISTFSKLTDAAGKKLDIGSRRPRSGRAASGRRCSTAWPTRSPRLSKQPENAAKWVKFLSGDGVPEHHRPVRRRLPGPAGRHRTGDRLQQGRAQARRHAVHRAGRRTRRRSCSR